MRDFTRDVWMKICRTLVLSGFTPLTVSKYLSLRAEKALPERFVILRHDVDRRVKSALQMAMLEKNVGISSTYYFRVPYTLNTEIIKTISEMGHEIGFHYECLSKTNGNFPKAYDLFSDELAQLREVSDVKTICMHGRPLSSHDNREMWVKAPLDTYGILGEAYLSVDDVCYFTDTGRSWDTKNSVRDELTTGREHEAVHSSEELMQWISTTEETRIYVTSHPERWGGSYADWIRCAGTDLVRNTGKKILRKVRE